MGEAPRKPCPDNPWQVLQYANLASRSRFDTVAAFVSSARDQPENTIARITVCNANPKPTFMIRPLTCIPTRDTRLDARMTASAHGQTIVGWSALTRAAG